MVEDRSLWRRSLVNGVVCELRLAPEEFLPAEILEQVVRSLEDQYPEHHRVDSVGIGRFPYLLTSLDGLWVSQIGPHGAVLRTETSSELEHLFARAQRLGEALRDASGAGLFQVVQLHYLNALPMKRIDREDLFTDWVKSGPWSVKEDFAQTLAGTFQGGQYVLHYGIHRWEEEPLYFSDARVLAQEVHARDLGDVLEDLDEEGLRLLSWPIAKQAFEWLEGWEKNPQRIRSVREQLSLMIDEASAPRADETNAERIALISKKYREGEFSAEDQERLEALTEEVRRLLPRVTEKDWKFLEEVSSRLDETERLLADNPEGIS